MSTFPVVNATKSQQHVAPLSLHDVPLELFIHILLFLRDADPPGVYVFHRRQLGWLNTTFVSKSWRMVALSNRSLWTRIPFGVGLIWPRVFLERSHPLPVVIDNLAYYTESYWSDVLSRNFFRVRTLELEYNTDDERRDPLYAILEQPSETLETLVLRRLWKNLEPPRLRPHQYPRLRKLHLLFSVMHAEDFPWHDIGIASLTELKIKVLHPRHVDRYVADVVYALKQLPSLVTFELSSRRRSDGDDIPPVDDSTPHSTYLSNLENLTLETDGDIILRILGLISFPMSATTTLITMPYGAIEHWASLHATLTPWIASQSKAGPPNRLIFTSGGHNRAQIHASRSLGCDCGVYLRLDVDAIVRDAFPSILYSLEPDGICVLDISILIQLSPSDYQILTHISSICRNITRITVTPSSASNEAAGLLATILRQILLPVAGTTACLPSPNVTTLDLTYLRKDMFLARCTYAEDVKPYRVMPPTLADTLTDIVKARRDASGVLPQTYLSDWTEPTSRFEEGVLDVVRSIPGVVFLHEGSRVPFDEV